MTVLTAIIAFIVALGPLIIFHELGHYWVARWCGVKVLRFSIGFGRPLLRSIRGKQKTEWVLAAIPFGGYVAMLDERESKPGTTYTEAELKQAFNRQSVWKRCGIVAAGPLANLILAVVIYWMIGLIGTEEPRAILGPPPAGSLAQQAGLQAGDEVRAMDGEAVQSMPDLHWRLLKSGVERGLVQLDVTDAQGIDRTVALNLQQFPVADLENQFVARMGLVSQPVPAVISQVVAGGVAAQQGLQAGDRITAINGKPIRSAQDLHETVSRSANLPLQLEVDRVVDGTGTRVQITLTPEEKTETAADGKSASKVGRIGVRIGAPLPMTTVRYGPIDAFTRALTRTWDVSILSLRLLGKMMTGEMSLKNLSGPITIADYAGQSAQLGVMIFLGFVAGISISVGIMNLLPIPMLDGGHLLYYAVEILSGRPPSERLMEWGQKLGLLMLAGLTVLALFNDFSRHL